MAVRPKGSAGCCAALCGRAAPQLSGACGRHPLGLPSQRLQGAIAAQNSYPPSHGVATEKDLAGKARRGRAG
jgi:hypothetical protein